jgi:hypothetical protein
MNKEDAKTVERFVKNARPADRVPFIMQHEIIDLLTEIRDELKAAKPKTPGRKPAADK